MHIGPAFGYDIGKISADCLVCADRLSWILVYVVIITAETAIITLVCWIQTVFINCNISILFLLFLLYGLTMISISFLVAPFFRKAEVAGNSVALAVFALGFVYMAVKYTRDFSSRDGPVSAVPSWCQWFLAFLSPVAFTLALDQVYPHCFL